jgi:hypothetical protein
MKLKKLIKLAAKGYNRDDDDNGDVLPDLKKHLRHENLGDLLGRFIVSELKSTFDPKEDKETQIAVAVDALTNARDDLDRTIDALLAESPLVEAAVSSVDRFSADTTGRPDQNVVYQFIAECGSVPPVFAVDYDQFGITWETYIEKLSVIGGWLAKVVGRQRFDDWYSLLEEAALFTCTQLKEKRMEADRNVFTAHFKVLLDKYPPIDVVPVPAHLPVAETIKTYHALNLESANGRLIFVETSPEMRDAVYDEIRNLFPCPDASGAGTVMAGSRQEAIEKVNHSEWNPDEEG